MEELESRKKPKRAKLRTSVAESDSSDDEREIALAKQLEKEESSGDEREADCVEEQDEEERIVQVGDYVLVKFTSTGLTKHYVGTVTDQDCLDMLTTVSFFKTVVGDKVTFLKSEPEDVAVVDNRDIVLNLPPPTKTGGTSRLAERLTFPISLSSYF